MNILSIVIGLFIVLESLNVLLLYFFPKSRKGNGMGAFTAFDESNVTPEVQNLIQYLIYWVAGTKIIFIALLIVIIVLGDPWVQFYSVIALILSISVFYWKLYPLIKSMDRENQITPKNYSKTLALTIACFLIVFVSATLYYYFFHLKN